MARLFANENLPEPVTLELRRLGHDVLTMRERGHAGRAVPDSEVLEFATGEHRAVVTLNRRHFVRLHQDRLRHAGINRLHVRSRFRRLGALNPSSRRGQLHTLGDRR